MSNYVFNLETTKIELHFDKSDYDAMTDEQRCELRRAFLWSRMGKCWVSRAKEPNLYRAKQVANKLGFTAEQREGERLTYGEQIERQTERAEARADRYDGYSDNAEGRAEQLQKPLNSMRGDIAFFTQPNINNSAGRAFKNQRERMYNQYHKGFEEYRKSSYFKDRAQTARETASQAQFDSPAYLNSRIKECKKRIKEIEKSLVDYEETLYKLEQGEKVKNYAGEIIPIDRTKSRIEYLLEQYEVAMDKQGYLENCLDALGGIRFNKNNVKVGYIVLIGSWGQAEIVSTGAQNVGFKILTGGASGGMLRASYAEIDEIIKDVEKKRAPHPFKVSEQFKAVCRDYSDSKNVFTTEKIYEIVKTSDTTIQLKPIGTDEKTITRKPVKVYNGEWRFSIDDTHRNTFYKKDCIEVSP